MYRCVYPQEILIQFFFSELRPLFELRNLTKMKNTTETVGQRNSSETAQQNCLNLVVMKDTICRNAYPQEIFIHFFSRNYALFELKNLTKIRDTTDIVCPRNSSEIAQQNFVT